MLICLAPSCRDSTSASVMRCDRRYLAFVLRYRDGTKTHDAWRQFRLELISPISPLTAVRCGTHHTSFGRDTTRLWNPEGNQAKEPGVTVLTDLSTHCRGGSGLYIPGGLMSFPGPTGLKPPCTSTKPWPQFCFPRQRTEVRASWSGPLSDLDPGSTSGASDTQAPEPIRACSEMGKWREFYSG